METILVDPGEGIKSFNTFGTSYWTSVVHHGLCSISAYAKSKGYKVSLLDIRRLKGWTEFEKKIASKKPQVVGLTMRSLDYAIVTKAVDIIKKIDRYIVTVVGGVHPTVATSELIPNKKINHIIVGEGEISFANLLSQLNRGKKPQRVIHGLSPDLDSLPFDDREFYDYKVSINFANYPLVFNPPMVTVIATRGCSFNCSFCQPTSKKMFGRKIRYRSVDKLIEELITLRSRYNFRSFKAYDDCFTLNTNWVDEFCDKYRRNGFTQEFIVQSRADIICKNESLIRKLAESGLRMIIVGFESGSQRVLDFLRKGTTVEQNLKAAKICKKYGILIVGNFMLGVPTETKEGIIETVKMAKKIKPYVASVSYYTPIPGSDLYDYCIENDLSLIESHDDYVRTGSGPKIRGIDYDFLARASEEILGMRFNSRYAGKIVRYLYVKTKSSPRLREHLVRCYTRVFAQ
jgi:radical SAM superfamily enzyme YgiQ (UPF0313 family)